MRIVIVGNGVAGVSAAETIRAEDKTSEIVLLTHERHTYYSRPRLVELLANKVAIEQIIIHDPAWYEKSGIELVRSIRVTGIDPGAKRLRDGGGGEYSYDKLVVATGALACVPSFVKPNSENMYTLRTIEDAETIKRAAMERKRAVVIGGGLLGLEVAGSLRALGVEVRVLELCERLLPRQLDHEGSAMLQKIFEDKGFTFLTGVRISSIEKKNDQVEIGLAGMGLETADFVVISAGIQPDFAVLSGTVVGRTRGITVDRYMRTSIPDVYSCGDAAEYCGTIYGLWQAGREQGVVCGSHILGKEVEYQGTVPSTRLKVAGVDVASVGEIDGKCGERKIVESDSRAGTYRKLFVRENKLVGAVLIGNAKDAGKLQSMIKRGEEMPA